MVIDLQPNVNNNVSEFSDLQLVVGATSEGTNAFQWQIVTIVRPGLILLNRQI